MQPPFYDLSISVTSYNLSISAYVRADVNLRPVNQCHHITTCQSVSPTSSGVCSVRWMVRADRLLPMYGQMWQEKIMCVTCVLVVCCASSSSLAAMCPHVSHTWGDTALLWMICGGKKLSILSLELLLLQNISNLLLLLQTTTDVFCS